MQNKHHKKKRSPHSNEFGAELIVQTCAHKDVFMHAGLPSSRCGPVCTYTAVKSVFGYISAYVHSVIKAPGVIKTQTRRPFI